MQGSSECHCLQDHWHCHLEAGSHLLVAAAAVVAADEHAFAKEAVAFASADAAEASDAVAVAAAESLPIESFNKQYIISNSPSTSPKYTEQIEIPQNSKKTQQYNIF